MHNLRNAENGRFVSKGIENVKAWVKKSNPDMEYVDGFTDFNSSVNIRCTICGNVFSKSMQTIRHGRKTICPF